MDNTERGAAALGLWREWIDGEFKLNPFVGSGVNGDWYSCFFCDEYQDDGFSPYDDDATPHHAADCVFVRARALVEEDANG